MKQIIFLTFLILNSEMAKAQKLPKTVDLPELGLRFYIPDGWSGGIQEDYILLGHETLPGMMLLFQNHSKTAQELKNLAEQGIVEDGVFLNPSNDFMVVSNKRVQGYYEGQYDGVDVKAYAVGLLNDFGSGLSLLIMTERDKFSNVHEKEAEKLLKAVHFSKPKRENNDVVQFWKGRLVGKTLKYLFTRSSQDFNGGSTGYNERRVISFCGNGRFSYYSSANASMDTGTNANRYNDAKTNNTGNYEIYTAQNAIWLKLSFDNAEAYTVELTTDDAGLTTFIDGSRYMLDGDAECQ